MKKITPHVIDSKVDAIKTNLIDAALLPALDIIVAKHRKFKHISIERNSDDTARIVAVFA